MYCKFIKGLTNVLYDHLIFVLLSVTGGVGETIELLKEGKILDVRSALLIKGDVVTDSVST